MWKKFTTQPVKLLLTYIKPSGLHESMRLGTRIAANTPDPNKKIAQEGAKSMIVPKLTRKPSLVLACFLLFTLVALPVPGVAQGVVKDVQEGVEKGAEEVKEGAETVGEKTKREKATEAEPSQETTAPSRTGSSESSQSTTSEDKDLPRTAGELPILLLTGLAFLGAGVTRVLRSK